MTSRNPGLISPPPLNSLVTSIDLSAPHSSSLTCGTLLSSPLTTSTLTSSPVLSPASRSSTASPDLFDDFTYSSDMDADFHRIDKEATESSEHSNDNHIGAHNDNDNDIDNDESGIEILIPTEPSSELNRMSKAWVVFRGRAPGIYDNGLSAALQTRAYSDAFQRAFPDLDAAQLAWNAYVRDGIYPDYGRSPWVVFLGRSPGVFTKVSELVASVEGYQGATFRCCSSVADGNTKFQLFTQRVVQMFAVPDPFLGVDALVQRQREEARNETPAAQPTVTVQVTQIRSQPSPPPQVAESSKSASKRKAVDPPLTASPQKSKMIRPGDGWYVVHTGVLPGVYYGVSALKDAKPRAGGFICAPNQTEADQLFLDLTVNCALVFVREE